MRLTWLGHSGFRMEIAGETLLVDPWLRGNPMFDESRFDEAVEGAGWVLVSHGHGDHAGDAAEIAKKTGAKIVGIYDFMQWMEGEHGVETVGFNKGGTVALGEVKVTMVQATHSSSFPGLNYAGTESGFMIAGEGKTVYFSGDTDVMADMQVFEALHAPEIGILCAGGHFTMDMKRAAFAAKTFFDFETVIPCHYRTFPLLEQDAAALRAELGGKVREPEVMVPIEL
ncbi:MAG TPA: metal-dependent hydrolase [Paracoccaceae bacterium]|nr:metal-dependent hydrolase [Paracoccaceae bacterium]